MKRCVVITGLGICTGVGSGADVFWRRLVSGESGIGPVTLFDTSHLPVRIGGQVQDLIPHEPAASFPQPNGERDRKVTLGLHASIQAVLDSGLDPTSLSDALLVNGVSLETFFLEDVAALATTAD